jgi:Methyltransferase domain
MVLFTLVYGTADIDGDVIEIGSWCGRSSSVLGFAAALVGNTNVYCIDLFPQRDDWRRNPDGSFSIAVKIGERTFTACEEQTVWAEPFERDIAPLYQRHAGTWEVFHDAIARNRLDHVVAAYKGTLATFSETAPPGLKCKLAFIDGDHSYRAVCDDIRNVEQFLVAGGWICLDDAYSQNHGIDRAIFELILSNPNYELGQQLTRKLFVARRKC